MKSVKLLLIAIVFVSFINICLATEYYCGDARYNYHIKNLYDSDYTAKQKCSYIKEYKVISGKPVMTYEQCIKSFNAAKAKYDRGMCVPIITKNHIYKDENLQKEFNCKVYLVKGTPRVIRTACDIKYNDIPESVADVNEAVMDIEEAAMFYFGKLYRRQYGIYDVE